MTEDHQDENLPNSEEPKAIVRRLTWPIDPSLPSRDVKTDRGPGGGSTAIPLGCDRRTRKFSSPLAPFVDVCVPRSPPPPLRTAASSTRASQGRHHQARHRHGPGFSAQAGVGIPVTGTYHHRTPCCASALVTCSTFVDVSRSPPSTSHTAASRHFSGDAEEDRRDGEEAGIAIRKNRDG